MSQNVLYCCVDCLVFARFRGDGGRLRMETLKVAEGAFNGSAASAAGINSLKLPRRFRRNLQLVIGDVMVLTKSLSVPAVAAGAQATIIAAEAARALPFPLATVAWGWATGESDGVEQTVRLQAIRYEAVKQLCAALDAAGCEPTRLHAVPEVVADILQNRTAEMCSMNVHVESTVIHLTSVCGSQLASRSHALPASVLEKEEEASRFAVAVKRFLAECRQQSVAGETIHLSVSGIEVKGLKAVLEQELALPVRPLVPECGISDTVDEALSERMQARLVPVMGGALSAMGASGVSIDLLPSSLKEPMLQKRNLCRWWMVAALVVLSGSALLAGAWTELQRAQAEAERWTAMFEPVALIHARIESERAELEILRTRRKQWEQLAHNRTAWIRFLGDVQERLHAVEDVWLDALELVPPQGKDPPSTGSGGSVLQLDISGRMVDRENPMAHVSASMQERATELLRRLGESPFVSAVNDSRFDTREQGILRFSCRLTIDPEHSL